MSPPAKVRHLHAILGRQRHLVIESGVDERVLRLVANEPGHPLSDKTRALLDQTYDRLAPFPLPPEFRFVRSRLIELKARPGSNELEEFLIEIDGWLRVAKPDSPVDALAVGYLGVLSLMSKGLHHGGRATWFGGRICWKQYLAEAEAQCQRLMRDADKVLAKRLNAGDRELVERLRPFLLINWLQLILEQAKKRYSRTMEEACALLRERQALPTLRRFLEQNPFLWQAAYNGVEQASVLRSEDDALYFYGKLKDLDPGFQSFDYSPGEVPALSEEPAMKWFCDHFRDTLHQPILPRKRIREA